MRQGISCMAAVVGMLAVGCALRNDFCGGLAGTCSGRQRYRFRPDDSCLSGRHHTGGDPRPKVDEEGTPSRITGRRGQWVACTPVARGAGRSRRGPI